MIKRLETLCLAGAGLVLAAMPAAAHPGHPVAAAPANEPLHAFTHPEYLGLLALAVAVAGAVYALKRASKR